LGVVLFTSFGSSNSIFDPGEPVRSGRFDPQDEVLSCRVAQGEYQFDVSPIRQRQEESGSTLSLKER
jgi:hypothetical protein